MTSIPNAKDSVHIWLKAKPILEDWQKRLSKYQLEHQQVIRRLVSSYSVFFRCPNPQKILVDLHFHPYLDRQKGEPASGLTSTGRIQQENAIYWLGQVSHSSPELEMMTTSKILHEEIHQDFQRELFDKVLAEANRNNKIKVQRDDLMADQAGYLEPESEMTATYLEHYANKRLASPQEAKTTVSRESLISYRLEMRRFSQIFKAVVDEDRVWKQDGPYTALRRGWGLPDMSRQSQVQSHDTLPSLNLYQLGAKITDFSLFELYHAKNQPLDLNFIKELYSLFLEQKRKCQ